MALICVPAIACRGPQSEDYVLLDALPNSATKEAVIAKVIVTSRKEHEATMKVLEAIRGVKSGEELTIYTSGSSCSWLDAKSHFFNLARSVKRPDLNHQTFITFLGIGSQPQDTGT
jgi:hypothetical protein